MQQVGKIIWKLLVGAAGAVAGLVLLYLALALILGAIPVNSSYAQAQDEYVEVFVTSNGVHTDFILPVATPYFDWRQQLPLHHFAGADSSYTHIAFGWGDRRFYMETPEWKDLTPSVALSAALWPTPSAMHVAYIGRPLAPNKQQRPLRLTPAQYRKLIRYITNSFQATASGEFILIPGAGYTSEDNFYEAHGKFYMLRNCNNWVNRGLKEMGVTSALWAPLPFAVMQHLR